MKLEQLQKDMIAAMKARDKVRKDAISTLIAGVKKTAIDNGCRDNVPEAMVDSAILKELKTAKEQIDTCPDTRPELKVGYTAVYEIMKEYAPSLMSGDEVRQLLQTRFADVLATKNKGLIMKSVMPELKGKADGKVISQVVAELCR